MRKTETCAGVASRFFSCAEAPHALKFAYASTCHSSQGCEHAAVVSVLDNHARFQTVEALYSSITRGKQGRNNAALSRRATSRAPALPGTAGFAALPAAAPRYNARVGQAPPALHQEEAAQVVERQQRAALATEQKAQAAQEAREAAAAAAGARGPGAGSTGR